ncbi:MAG: hydantoinase/oxoprolinase family protein [Myxococcales bacterium]|nr:hydantoinase/oxoprolinase family protein [Myxococcales bacterium]
MRIGVDTGGTFTDLVAVGDDGVLRFAKLPSTPDDPARAVLDGIARVGGAGPRQVVHGTTVATNALLTRSGGPTALITTRGFEDVLALRRQARPRLYALEPEVPPPLCPDDHRLGIDERLGPGGDVLRALESSEIERVVAEVRSLGARSVAVVLLHAYADPAHERRIGAALASLEIPIALSCDVLPEHREYERTVATVVDAYVSPGVATYLRRLEAALGPTLRVMQSSGGASAAREARLHPVRTLLSGPAAGVIGARAVAARAGIDRLITLDVGGTSTDVALCDRRIELTVEGEVAGLPIRIPSLPVHTVGAGGGSIARLDPGGALKVGPGSAGAVPGPACYGAGGREPTVTDAALCEGRLDPDRFLGGAIPLSRAAAERVLDPLAAQMGVSRAAAVAGIARVATAVTARAIRTISVERGHDPRDFTLVAFGGAGAMQACDVAAELGITRVLVPPVPGLLCAYGALCADVTRDRVATRLRLTGPSLDVAALASEFAPLEAAARADLDDEGVPTADRRFVRSSDLRYAGQSYELGIELPARGPFDVVAAFHDAHRRRFGFSSPARPVERVALRVHARGLTAPVPPLTQAIEPGDPRIGDRLLLRARLRPGATVDGPALIVDHSATVHVAAGWRATVDGDGALHLQRG